MITHSCDSCGCDVPPGGTMVMVTVSPVTTYTDSVQPFSQRDVPERDRRTFEDKMYLCPVCGGSLLRLMRTADLSDLYSEADGGSVQ